MEQIKKDARLMNFKEWEKKYRLQLLRFNSFRLFADFVKPVKRKRKKKAD